jgi:hypothetical protein
LDIKAREIEVSLEHRHLDIKVREIELSLEQRRLDIAATHATTEGLRAQAALMGAHHHRGVKRTASVGDAWLEERVLDTYYDMRCLSALIWAARPEMCTESIRNVYHRVATYKLPKGTHKRLRKCPKMKDVIITYVKDGAPVDAIATAFWSQPIDVVMDGDAVTAVPDISMTAPPEEDAMSAVVDDPISPSVLDPTTPDDDVFAVVEDPILPPVLDPRTPDAVTVCTVGEGVTQIPKRPLPMCPIFQKKACMAPAGDAIPVATQMQPPIGVTKKEDTELRPGEWWNLWPTLVSGMEIANHERAKVIFVERFVSTLTEKWCDIMCRIDVTKKRRATVVWTTLHATHPLIPQLRVWLRAAVTGTDNNNTVTPIFPVPIKLDPRPPLDAPGALSVFGVLDTNDVWKRVTTAHPALEKMLGKYKAMYDTGCGTEASKLMAALIHRERVQYWQEQTALGVMFTYKEVTDRLFRCHLNSFRFVPNVVDARCLMGNSP